MFNLILKKLFGSVGKRLDGYKTKIGGVGSIAIGTAGIVRLLFPDMTTLPDLGFEASAGFIVAGFTALGLGGKAEKQKTVTVQQNALLDEQNSILSLIAKTNPGPAIEKAPNGESKGPACSGEMPVL